LKNQKYSEYFIFEYELNPLHKKDIEKSKLFNIRQIAFQ